MSARIVSNCRRLKPAGTASPESLQIAIRLLSRTRRSLKATPKSLRRSCACPCLRWCPSSWTRSSSTTSPRAHIGQRLHHSRAEQLRPGHSHLQRRVGRHVPVALQQQPGVGVLRHGAQQPLWLGAPGADRLVDKWVLYRIAQYCDGMVEDGFGGMEPRFTCNLVLQSQGDALKVMQDLATVFRGVIYATGGSITAVGDMPEDPVYTYTPGQRHRRQVPLLRF